MYRNYKWFWLPLARTLGLISRGFQWLSFYFDNLCCWADGAGPFPKLVRDQKPNWPKG